MAIAIPRSPQSILDLIRFSFIHQFISVDSFQKKVSGLLNEPGKTFSLDDKASSESSIRVNRNLQYSVNQITTFHSSFNQDVTSYIDAGIPAIGLWKRKIDDCDQAEVVERLRAAELPVSTFSHVGGFTGSNGLTFNEALDEAYDSLFLAKAVGAKAVIVAPGTRGNQFTQSHERRLVCEAIRELAFVAEDLNLDLALQPMRPEFSKRWSFLHSIDDMQRLMDRVNHSRVKMVLDTFHLANEPELLQRLGGLVSRIGVVQLSDASHTSLSDHERCLPGRGNLPLRQIINRLNSNGYSGYFDIQVWSPSVWKSDADRVLAECRSAMKSLSCTKEKASVSS